MAGAAGLQMVAPRQKPGTGLGHRAHNAFRQRSLALLESACFGLGTFGPSLLARRRDIEGSFGRLTAFGGGLTCLPAWVRRPWRVRNWVHAKLLIDAARQLVRHGHRQPVAA